MSENLYHSKCEQHLDGNVKRQSGHIELIIGPMFSGKTTELIRRLKRYRVAQYGCLIVKYAGDTRYTDSGVATHDRQTLPAVSTKTLEPVFNEALRYDVIGIDEGQFFPDVVSFSDKLANEGKIVIVAALDGTFQKKHEPSWHKDFQATGIQNVLASSKSAFGDILNLVPVAENVTKLSAICALCCQSAAFTRRKTKENEVEVIGGGDKYLAVCRSCFTTPIPGSPDRQPLRDFNTPVDAKLLAKTKTHRRIFEETSMSGLV